MWRGRLERYRERLSDERMFGNDFDHVELTRGLFRSSVSVRFFGRRVAYRTLRDREAEQLYGEAVELWRDKRETAACDLVRG